MKTILILTFFILTTSSNGQKTDIFEPFNRTDYPKEKYQITSDSFQLENILIEIKQVRPLNTALQDNFFPYCRAWLTINKNGKPLYQKFFKSLWPVGGCLGLIFPNIQPRQDYFILSLFSGYDGRIYIIDSLGNLTEKIGGDFFVSKDKRYLFSRYASDMPGLTVYDFSKGQTLFSDTISPRLYDWYYKDNKYISRIDLGNNMFSQDGYYYFDFAANKLIFLKQAFDYLKSDDRLSSYNEKDNRKYCLCGNDIRPMSK